MSPTIDPGHEPADGGKTPTLHLARWTITSGSNVQSRGAVVIASGDHQWDASSEGNGAVDALLRAVDAALVDVLEGHPRLVAYDVHAIGEGPGAEGRVTLSIAPPSAAEGARGTGRYDGSAQSTNIIAASVDAYVEAINAMLGESHWAGATESAGNERRRVAREATPRRAEVDKDAARKASVDWFDS